MLTKTELLAVAHHEGSWGWDSSYGSRIVKLDCQLLDPSSASSDTLLSAYTLIAQDSHRSLLAREPSVFQYRRNFLRPSCARYPGSISHPSSSSNLESFQRDRLGQCNSFCFQ
jgi:hypothetical protein